MGLSRTGPPALFTSESAVEARLDRSEWQRIYEECFPRVFRALVAAGARPDEAEDALHDAFEKALTRQDEIVRPEGWLFVVRSEEHTSELQSRVDLVCRLLLEKKKKRKKK